MLLFIILLAMDDFNISAEWVRRFLAALRDYVLKMLSLKLIVSLLIYFTSRNQVIFSFHAMLLECLRIHRIHLCNYACMNCLIHLFFNFVKQYRKCFKMQNPLQHWSDIYVIDTVAMIYVSKWLMTHIYHLLICILVKVQWMNNLLITLVVIMVHLLYKQHVRLLKMPMYALLWV